MLLEELLLKFWRTHIIIMFVGRKWSNSKILRIDAYQWEYPHWFMVMPPVQNQEQEPFSYYIQNYCSEHPFSSFPPPYGPEN